MHVCIYFAYKKCFKIQITETLDTFKREVKGKSLPPYKDCRDDLKKIQNVKYVITNFEHISHLVLVFLLLTLSR